MHDSLDALEWPDLQAVLLNHCQTPYGQRLWETSAFLNTPPLIQGHLNEVQAFQQLLVRYEDAVVSTQGEIPDITEIPLRLAKGGFITASQAGEFLRVLQFG